MSKQQVVSSDLVFIAALYDDHSDRHHSQENWDDGQQVQQMVVLVGNGLS